MAQQQPTDLEAQFEKLQQLIGQGQHAKVIKAADTSEGLASVGGQQGQRALLPSPLCVLL